MHMSNLFLELWELDLQLTTACGTPSNLWSLCGNNLSAARPRMDLLSTAQFQAILKLHVRSFSLFTYSALIQNYGFCVVKTSSDLFLQEIWFHRCVRRDGVGDALPKNQNFQPAQALEQTKTLHREISPNSIYEEPFLVDQAQKQQSEDRDVHRIHGRKEGRLPSVLNSDSSCKKTFIDNGCAIPR